MRKHLLSLTLLIFHLPSFGAIIYVNQAATGSNNGSSWNNAYVELVDAINSASSGDELWVAKGVYLPDWNGVAHTGDRTLKILITQPISIYGGFAGNETALSQRNWILNPTILSGDLNNDDVITYPTFANRTDNAAAFLQIGSSVNAVIDGMTFSGAHLLMADPGWGGIINLIGNINFKHCTFKDNYTERSGVIEEPSSTSTFENCLFLHNKVERGVIYTHDNGTNIINCTFVKNHSGASTIYNFSMGIDMHVCNNIFWGNTSSDATLSTQDIQINNRQYYTSFQNNIVEGWTGTLGGVNFPSNYNTNPNFISGTDFRLQSSSPAIDQGDNTCSSSSLDLDGKTRISSTVIDIGAYEYSSSMPIELYIFDGWKEGNKNKLVWQSESEVNNDFYTLERSTDRLNFITIAIVDGAGNSNTLINYDSYDSKPSNGINYYRLRLTDYDGTYTFSNIIAIQNTEIKIIALYPNPSVEWIEFIISSNQREDITYELIDILGRIHFKKEATAHSGNTLFKINVQNLSSGTYILRAYTHSGLSYTYKEFIVN